MNKDGRPKLTRKKWTNLKVMLEKRQLSVNKASKLLNISDQTLHNWIRFGVPEAEVSRIVELFRKVKVR